MRFKRVKAFESPFQFTRRLKLPSAHWSGGGFSQAACTDGLDNQKAWKREKREREGRLVQETELVQETKELVQETKS